MPAVWKHSIAVGAMSKRIAAADGGDTQQADHALMAGLLHDSGKLILAAHVPEGYGRALNLARERRIPDWQAERETLETTHGEVGAYLLGLWGLPDPIVEAVAFHHCPEACPGRTFSPLTAVHVADAFENAMRSEGDSDTPPLLRDEYLQNIRLAHRLDAWRQMCEQTGRGEAA